MKDVILSTLSFFYSQITPESPYGLERAEEFFNNNSLFEKKIKFVNLPPRKFCSGKNLTFSFSFAGDLKFMEVLRNGF
jgi:hypothetical protein